MFSVTGKVFDAIACPGIIYVIEFPEGNIIFSLRECSRKKALTLS